MLKLMITSSLLLFGQVSAVEAKTIFLVCDSRNMSGQPIKVTVLIDTDSKYVKVEGGTSVDVYRDGVRDQYGSNYVIIQDDYIYFGVKGRTNFAERIDRRTLLSTNSYDGRTDQCHIAPNGPQF
jgi:hypothetical protein